MNPMICIILGTRPEIIKLAPVIHECKQRGLEYFIIHTGQHYQYELDQIFFHELDLPKPTYNLSVGSHTHGKQTGMMIEKIEAILISTTPTCVVVQGDTNSALAGALAACKLHIPLAHIEAGLRSFDRTMPEETNRVIVDHISTYAFAPTTIAQQQLQNEGIKSPTIFVVGNTIVDSLYRYLPVASKRSTILNELSLMDQVYCLLTLHRAENTEDITTLERIIKALETITKSYTHQIVWPMHPRMTDRLHRYGLMSRLQGIGVLKIVKPVGFFDFLELEQHADRILTDSGGVQEEACILNIPCLTLRENTERPETITVGANKLVGTDTNQIVDTFFALDNVPRNWNHPFGDGTTSKKILDIVTC